MDRSSICSRSSRRSSASQRRRSSSVIDLTSVKSRPASLSKTCFEDEESSLHFVESDFDYVDSFISSDIASSSSEKTSFSPSSASFSTSAASSRSVPRKDQLATDCQLCGFKLCRDELRIACKLCGDFSNSLHSLFLHVQQVHQICLECGLRSCRKSCDIICKECKVFFGTPHSVATHSKRVHDRQMVQAEFDHISLDILTGQTGFEPRSLFYKVNHTNHSHVRKWTKGLKSKMPGLLCNECNFSSCRDASKITCILCKEVIGSRHSLFLHMKHAHKIDITGLDNTKKQAHRISDSCRTNIQIGPKKCSDQNLCDKNLPVERSQTKTPSLSSKTNEATTLADENHKRLKRSEKEIPSFLGAPNVILINESEALKAESQDHCAAVENIDPKVKVAVEDCEFSCCFCNFECNSVIALNGHVDEKHI